MTRTDLQKALVTLDRIAADLDRLLFAARLCELGRAVATRIERAQMDMVACRALINLELGDGR